MPPPLTKALAGFFLPTGERFYLFWNDLTSHNHMHHVELLGYEFFFLDSGIILASVANVHYTLAGTPAAPRV